MHRRDADQTELPDLQPRQPPGALHPREHRPLLRAPVPGQRLFMAAEPLFMAAVALFGAAAPLFTAAVVLSLVQCVRFRLPC